jgi:hypothetical protein
MSTRVRERVEEWGGRPFSGGYGTLRDLAAEGFSGVVTAGGTELYMTKGTVVGIHDGTIESFEDVSGTVHEAPTPALPLLAVMQARGEEVRAQYYSEDTRLAEVDDKLESGGFTGFVELSENVLSGDYYVVYHQGRSMSVAFVGNTERRVEDEEAFDRANDEVGIYTVHPVDIQPISIPEPATPDRSEPDDADGGAGPAVSDVSGHSSDSQTDPADDPEPSSDTTEPDSSAGGGQPGTEEDGAETSTRTAPAGGGQSTTREAGDPPLDAAASGQTDRDGTVAERTDTADTETRPETSEHPEKRDTADDRETSEGVSDREAAVEARTDSPADTGDAESPQGPDASARQEERGESTRSEAGQSRTAGSQEPSTAGDTEPDHGLETRAVPSLDPGRTQSSDGGSGDPQPEPSASGDRKQTRPEREDTQSRDGQPQGGADRQSPSSGGTSGSVADRPGGREATTDRTPDDPARLENLESELEDREAEVDRLEGKLQSATEKRDQLRTELEALRSERDELAAEVDRLEGKVQRLETEFGTATDGERSISPEEALAGTNIFLRYNSKGDATLEKAHDGKTRQSDVIENLRLEKHTQFDADSVVVGSQPSGEFIEETVVYQFVDWVATELLFEIRETGHADTLKTLYNALPQIDRAELSGSVDVVYTEDGQEARSTESFDVVLRDRMGEPLMVANLNDSREAATEAMMERLITSAERVGQAGDRLAAAFFVTESFFEPSALETAGDATRGGLLSRNKQKSFVNLSRKRGYHLCLVEARSEKFNLTVPDL